MWNLLVLDTVTSLLEGLSGTKRATASHRHTHKSPGWLLTARQKWKVTVILAS